MNPLTHEEITMRPVTFIEHDGTAHEVAILEGESLMEMALGSAVPGIDGDCGGEAACGTCHIIVDSKWISTVGTRSEQEGQMLEMSPECESSSRLACQVTACEALAGLTVRLPEFQM
ncbi:2Fe-2S iron-sulfur cluster-binding protein [Aeromicrobium sp. Sec7.5]|uniref:2Fe-2S iron-sulfur cluster-binding protein n=1 Tax=Aeromicrobium sp. Sec7.5 TaxID=3121276 RepID=UPI002FE437A0